MGTVPYFETLLVDKARSRMEADQLIGHGCRAVGQLCPK